MKTYISPMSVNTKKILPKSKMAFVFPKDRQERMSSISQQISEILSSLMNGFFE